MKTLKGFNFKVSKKGKCTLIIPFLKGEFSKDVQEAKREILMNPDVEVREIIIHKK